MCGMLVRGEEHVDDWKKEGEEPALAAKGERTENWNSGRAEYEFDQAIVAQNRNRRERATQSTDRMREAAKHTR
jgi:hypothetical protein